MPTRRIFALVVAVDIGTHILMRCVHLWTVKERATPSVPRAVVDVAQVLS